MIEVSHVSRNFGTFRAVNDVSFSIPTGQIVGLLGPNGAGKTTTMRMITGFLSPSEGKILIDGIDVSENPVETKKKIGYMPESAPLYGEMIVEDYLNMLPKSMVKIQKNEFHNFAKNVDSKKLWTKISANFLAETNKELLWLTLLWQIQKF